jgi:nitrite reductase/ring-hydroxylating ferredoxin subunit
MAEFKLCATDEIHGDTVVCKRVSGLGQVAVARLSDGSGYVAFKPSCPHARGPLFEGKRNGDVIICPWHFFRFDLKTGESPSGTSILHLQRYPVTVRQNVIYAEAE